MTLKKTREKRELQQRRLLQHVRLTRGIRLARSTPSPAIAFTSVGITRNDYHTDDFIAVTQLLAAHPNVFKLLMELPSQVRRYFPSAPLHLEIVTDPESGERSLLALVRTEKNFEAAWRQFEAFRQEWWLENAERADYKLHVDLGRA